MGVTVVFSSGDNGVAGTSPFLGYIYLLIGSCVGNGALCLNVDGSYLFTTLPSHAQTSLGSQTEDGMIFNPGIFRFLSVVKYLSASSQRVSSNVSIRNLRRSNTN